MMLLLQLQAAGTVNQLQWYLSAVDQLVSTAGPILVPVAQQWGAMFAVGALTFWCAKWACDFIMHRGMVMLPEAILLVLRMLIVSLMLGYWPQFTGAILAGANEIAGMIDLTTVDKLQDLIDACAAGLEHPPVWNFFGLFVYIFVLGGMVCLDATLLLITGLGFFAVGLGQVFGPLIVTFLLIPGWSGKFWRWVDFMWVYSWYRAVAAAYVWVVSNFLINFFQNSVNGDYSLGHFAGLALLMLSSILMVVFGAFKVPAFTAELFGGGLGHAGANFGESVRAFVYMVAMG